MIQQIMDGRTDLVFDYISAGNDPNTKDAHGRPLIIWCAYYGDVTAIKFLVSKGASLQDLGPNYDLNGAAFHGHWQLCQYLIETGADVSFMLPGSGETALHNCIKPNRPVSNYLVELFLRHGADPNARTKTGEETGSFMRDVRTKGETPLHRAAAFGNEQTIRLLLQGGADKTIKDAFGDSPMSWASWHNRPGKILALLAYAEHQIHPLHEERMLKDHGFGYGSGLEINLLGKMHLESD